MKMQPEQHIRLDEKALLSEEEVAAYLGVSRPTVRVWVADGEFGPVVLPNGKLGGETRRNLYRRKDIDWWLATLSTKGIGSAEVVA